MFTKYISENYYALNDIDNHTFYLNLYKQKTNTDISAKKKSVNQIIVKQTTEENSTNGNSGKYWIIIILCIFDSFGSLSNISDEKQDPKTEKTDFRRRRSISLII